MSVLKTAMYKDFDQWNKSKKHIHNRIKTPLFHEREVWWCALGLNIGSEQDGKNNFFERPVIILKKFNRSMAWVVPLTKTHKDSIFHVSITSHDSSAILSQLRIVSSQRLLRKAGYSTKEEFHTLKNKLLFLVHSIPDEIKEILNPLQEIVQ
jgi:mRNA interferase MazF